MLETLENIILISSGMDLFKRFQLVNKTTDVIFILFNSA